MDKKIAEEITNAIMVDLDDRNGFDILHLDDEILSEIREAWIGIILAKTPPEPVVPRDAKKACLNCNTILMEVCPKCDRGGHTREL